MIVEMKQVFSNLLLIKRNDSFPSIYKTKPIAQVNIHPVPGNCVSNMIPNAVSPVIIFAFIKSHFARTIDPSWSTVIA